MKFFISDLHFGSEHALKSDNRPFKTSKQFEKFVVKTWNKQASRADEIYVIGDFVDYHECNSANWKKSLQLVNKINAKVFLILGNNEERVIKNEFSGDFEAFKKLCIDLGFEDVQKEMTIEVCGTTFFLTHKPKNHSKDMLTLFGHSHRAMGLYKSFGFNIGCDLNHFRLFGEKDIKHLLSMKEKYWDIDENLKLV